MGTNEIEDDGLTPEEREALALDDGDETTETESDGGEADAADESDAGEDVGADAAGESGAGADADAADAGANADAEEGAAEPEATPASAPILVAEAPADAEAKLSDIAIKKDELLTKFDDGDMTAKEYQRELDALNKQEREIELAVHKASLAAEMEQQRQKNEWISTVNRFIVANPVYDPQKSPRLYRALDAEVRDLAVKPEAANWTGEQILAEAHKNLAAEFGFAAQKEAQDDIAKNALKNAKKHPIPKPDLPPTLAKVPAAQVSDTAGGKFAALDRLMTADPIKYEEALMKLSDAERAEYLAAA